MLRSRGVGLLLFLVTLVVYLPVLRDGFLNYDDNDYVTQNVMVQRGVTWEGVKWAFNMWHASNWHPLTWLSHMLDCDLFRLNPAGHHLVNVLFHAVNVWLVFVLLLRLTDSLWPSAMVATLFAWHPLHVESVAWVSERKDVLSTFFALWSLLCYVRYAKTGQEANVSQDNTPVSITHHRLIFYWLALFFFALGLMSKPMIVTLPFVMVLLDYWPLQRTRPLWRIFWEKCPFFLLTIGSCIVTVLAQWAKAIAPLSKFPLGLRLENAITAYVIYLWKAIWPLHLAVFYPMPKHIPWLMVVLAGLVLTIISVFAWVMRRKLPYLLVGWLWYLGTLVPVIGLVQVGDQSLADRYTYIPLIGIFLAITLAARDCARHFQFGNRFLIALAVLVCVMCVALTENQLRYWRNSQTLFTHALTVTRDNALDHLNLGEAYQEQHQWSAALVEYRKVLRLDPTRHEAYNNIGRILNDEGKPEQALEYCRAAVRLDPKSAYSHDGLGVVLLGLGRLNEAAHEFSEALRLNDNDMFAHFQLGRTLMKQGRDTKALQQLHAALQLHPDNFQVIVFTARVLASDPDPTIRNGKEALALADRAGQLAGHAQPVVLDTLAMAYAEMGQFNKAVQAEQQAIQLAKAEGHNDDVMVMQQRLELYTKHQPWREIYAK